MPRRNSCAGSDNLGTILALVREGVGCTVISYGAVHSILETGSIRIAAIESPGIPTDLSLVTNVKRPVTAAVRTFKSFVRAEVERVVTKGELPPQHFRLAPPRSR